MLTLFSCSALFLRNYLFIYLLLNLVELRPSVLLFYSPREKTIEYLSSRFQYLTSHHNLNRRSRLEMTLTIHTYIHIHIHTHTHSEAHFISLVFLRKCRNKTKQEDPLRSYSLVSAMVCLFVVVSG